MPINLIKKPIALQFFTKALPISSFLEFLAWTVFCLPLVFLATHITSVYNEKKVIENYSNNIVSRTKQISFQLINGLNIADKSTHKACSNEDLNALRKSLSHYHYLKDIGRIKDNQILCTAIWGKLNEPKPLSSSNVNSNNKKIELYWNRQEDLFVIGEDHPIYGLNNTIALISPSAFSAIHRSSQKSGAIIYSYNGGFVYERLGDTTKKQVKELFQEESKITDWLPLPGKSIHVKTCIKKYDFCTVTVDSRLGIFELSFLSIVFLFLSGMGLGYVLFWCKEYILEVRYSLKYRFNFAIENNLIYPLYQPKVNLQSKKIIGVEALARWDDKELGNIPPDTFITLAEKTGKIKDVTKSLTKKILYDTHDILKEREDFTVSINLSAQDLENDDFLDFIENETSLYEINHHQIIFEITERSATESKVMAYAIRNLSKCGYQISLDDFGTGFSNLSWLSKFEPNEIKIDKMFIQSTSTESVGKITFNSICQLLENYDVKTVFEGIETKEEMEYIMTKSPNAIGQGWLMSKARPIEDIKAFLAEDITFK